MINYFTMPILSKSDITYILSAPKIRIENDAAYAKYLLKTLVFVAEKACLKDRFFRALYNLEPAKLLLVDMDKKQVYNGQTYDLEEIISEFNTLEDLSTACGKHVISFYEESAHALHIFLEFQVTVPPVETPVDEDLLNRRLEKETSW
jgi:hypothetical protein